VEDREDLGELLLRGLPEDEREHVINVIKQGDAEKLRRKRAESAAERAAERTGPAEDSDPAAADAEEFEEPPD
jgi:hypothetical protein